MRRAWIFLRSYLSARNGLRFADRAALEKYQARKLAAFQKQHLTQSPFYRGYVGKDLADFPLMNKALMMGNFDDINTRGLKLNEAMSLALRAEEARDFKATLQGVTVGLSSGTSGNRGLFAVDGSEQATWAGVVLARALDKSIFARHKLAFFLRAGSNLYDNMHKRGRLTFRFFDLTRPFDEHLRRLNSMQPTQVVAPSRVLRLIAEAQAQGKINIHPRRLTSVAEVLDPLDAAYIAEVFGQPVHQVYQCTEGFLGYTCEHNRLHLNEEFLIVEREWIDRDSGRFIPIITDFTRHVQPVVRYRLDDILVLDDRPCPCGRVSAVIRAIEGRMDDVLYGHGVHTAAQVPIFPDYLRQLVIRSSPHIRDYRIVQESPHAIRIGVDDALPGDDWDMLVKNLGAAFVEHRCTLPLFRRESLREEMLTDKQRRIRREVGR